MVGAQTALKAVWAALLKQPPEPAFLEGGTTSAGYRRCLVPRHTVGTWTTRIARLPVSGGWHALVYTRMAEYAFDREAFLLLAQNEEEAPALHYRFLDRRSPLPLHRSWADWLWRRGLESEVAPLQSVGVLAYRCDPDAERLPRRPLRSVLGAYGRWIGRCSGPRAATSAAGSATTLPGAASPPTAPAATAPTTEASLHLRPAPLLSQGNEG